MLPQGDGRNWTLMGCLYYTAADGTQYRGMPGGTTDGPSVPDALDSVESPFGPVWLPAVLHDLAYRVYLEVMSNGFWMIAVLPKDACDNLFNEAMISTGVPHAKRLIFYEAVHLGGQSSFDYDRALYAARRDAAAVPVPKT